MGDPLYSLHATDAASEGLYGQFSAWENLEVAGRNLVRYVGVVPLVLVAPAVLLLVRDRTVEHSHCCAYSESRPACSSCSCPRA